MDVKTRLARLSRPDPTGCVLFTGYIHKTGYGNLRVDGKMCGAHRVAYEAFIGPIPSGSLVCHHCDVRACIRPEHLFLGSHADNVADMIAKKRKKPAKGERVGSAKLSVEQVREIKTDRRSIRRIAESYSMGSSAIWQIKSGRNWKHL